MKVKAYTCRKRNTCSLYFCVFMYITSILGAYWSFGNREKTMLLTVKK